MAVSEHGPATLQDIADNLGAPWDIYRVLNRAQRCGVPAIIEGRDEPLPLCWPPFDSCSLPADFVEACRLLAWDGFGHVLQYAQHADKRCTYTRKVDGLTLALDQTNPRWLLRYARNTLAIGPQSDVIKAAGEEMTDAECLAVLAIREAWWTLDAHSAPLFFRRSVFFRSRSQQDQA